MHHPPASKMPAAIGILVMDARIERIPGDIGSPATFPFPVLCRKVVGATLKRLIAERDPGLLAPFIDTGWDLVREGVKALTTSCGFMILFQEELSREFPVPVFTSSLLQLPFIQATLRPQDRIGILTADASNLTPDHLRRGGGDLRRLTVHGLQAQPHFREAVLEESGRIDVRKVKAEVVERAREMVAADPEIRAILFECANLPPYAGAVREALGLPVYDAVTMIRHVHAALAATPFNT